jgi:DNA-binding Lrp family transcriptional regulator
MDLSEILKNIDIISIFKDDPFSAIPTSEIERRLQLSHHPTFRRLKMLEEHEILTKMSGGYCLNMQNELTLEIMRFLSSVEKIKKWKKSKE